jgi:branched-subunit amino acid permease
MVYSYIQLTTEYKGVPDSIDNILVPIMFVLYFIAFVIVLLNFFRHTIRKKDIVNTCVSVFRE